MKRHILNPITTFSAGLLLGAVSKLLDVYADGRLLWELGYLFSDIQIWILLGVLISIYSDTAKKAALNIFPFCVGMLLSYYAIAELLNAVYGWPFIKGWLAFSCCTPVFAWFTWHIKEKGLLPRLVSVGIVLVTAGSALLLGAATFLDYLCVLAIFYAVFFLKAKRTS